jgi:sensor histidine kinase regulating citrate/malate metabolism
MQNAMIAPIIKKAKRTNNSDNLWWHIGILLMLVIAFVLSLISFLNYSNYRKTYLDLNFTRYLVMGKDLRQTIETGLNIGLSASENTNLRPTMKELAKRQNDTRYIAIVNDVGGIVIKEGEIPDDNWKTRFTQTENDAYWRATDAETFQIGMPFYNNFNIKIGAVIIGYDRVVIEAATSDMLRKLALNLLQSLILSAAVIFAGAYLLTRKLKRELAVIDKNIEASLNDEPQNLAEGALGSHVAWDINAFAILSRDIVHEMKLLELECKTTVNGDKT